MHRFYLAPERTSGEMLSLEGREAHHVKDVLRLRRGDAVEILNGAGEIYTCELTETGKSRVELRKIKRRFVAPLPWKITLFQSLPKGKNFVWIVEKATELGGFEIVPIITERVVSNAENSEHKLERWQLTAIDAIKQCGSPWLPLIRTPMKFPAALSRNREFDLSLVGSLHGQAKHPREYLNKVIRTEAKVAIWIGPEGDFTEREIADLLDAGAQPITLGSLVLRVETAAIYALSILNYEMQLRPSSGNPARA